MGFLNFKKINSLNPSEVIAKESRSLNGITNELKSNANKIVKDMIGSGSSLSSIQNKAGGMAENALNQLRADSKGIFGADIQRIEKSALEAKRNVEKKIVDVNAKISNVRKADSTITTLEYPPDKRKYHMRFGISKYTRPTAFDTNEGRAFTPTSTIVLPVPSALIDTIGLRLSPSELGGLIGSGMESISDAVNTVKSGGFGALKGKALGMSNDQALRAAGSAGYAAGYSVLRAGTSLTGQTEMIDTVGQLVGAIPNPHMTVFFQGVDLRTHQFTWKFAPRNVKESQLIQNIINEFKKISLPNKAFGDAFVMGYPHIVLPSLEPNGNQLYPFKRCMIESVSTNFAPNGPSFFKDGYPSMVEFSITLKELEIFMSEDFGGESGDEGDNVMKDAVTDPNSSLEAGISSPGGFGGFGKG